MELRFCRDTETEKKGEKKKAEREREREGGSGERSTATPKRNPATKYQWFIRRAREKRDAQE